MDGSSGTGASDKLTGRRFSERSGLLGEQRDLGQTKRVSRHGRSSLAEPEPKARSNVYGVRLMKQNTPDDVIWALTEADKSGAGLTPQAKSTALFADFLAGRGYLHKSDVNPTWGITRAGKAVLAGEASLTSADLEALNVFRRAV